MKKLRKLLAGFMMLAMVISLLPMLAPITAYGDPITTDATIDTSETGSLTLYKYESSTSYAGDPGTGLSQTQVGDGNDDTLRPIQNVGFTLYKVCGVNDQTFTYYTKDGNALPTETYAANAIPSSWTKITDVGFLDGQKLTDVNGKVEWTGLDLGIYYVVETKAPASAISAPVKFYVSIPMTKTDGSDWLYDVVVYPKNQTTYADLTLSKTGNGAPLNGAKFVLQYRADDSDAWKYVENNNGSGYTYTSTSYDSSKANYVLSDGSVTFSSLMKGQYRFIEVYAPDGYIMDGATAYKFTIEDDGTITYSTSNDWSSYSSGAKTITVDNQLPTLEKKVKDRISSEWVDKTDYSVGDEIPYKITIGVPENITLLTTFTVTDDPTNLIDQVLDSNDNSLITLKCGDSDVNTDAYTVAESDDGFTITFDPANMGDYAGEDIVISYNAILQSGASTTSANSNTATLTYSNKIKPNADTSNPNSSSGDPGTSNITDDAKVYTFELILTKQFTGAVTDKTYEAKFKLYREVANSSEKLKYDGVEKSVELVDAAITGADNNGEVTLTGNGTTEATKTFSGLENGTYYLVETHTANGYNLLKQPVQVVLSKSYSGDNPSIEATSETIVNSKGFTLPTTGGVGTYIFIFVGVSMMAAAVILFFVTKKKDVKKSI